MSGSASADLLLVEEGLACEVAQPTHGAVITKMSWRGTKATSGGDLTSRFDAWLSRVEIVGAPLRAGSASGPAPVSP